MTCVVVGASSGLGRAIAEELGRLGHALLLVSSEERDLAPLASDLAIRFGAAVRVLAADASNPAAFADSVDGALDPGEAITAVLFPIGAVEEEDGVLLAPERAERLVSINFASVVSVVGRLLPRLVARGKGTIAGFGSVAALRGRSRNAVYAAAKRSLESYFESLRHFAEPRGVTVAFYVLGYLDTQMAWGRRLLLPKADPRAVARRVCGALGREAGRHYIPGFWNPAGILLRALPWPIFRRLEF
ncbi:MAG TPA: SDR family NAD(P)-dependent oxidoreductase [Thermoanaerobaculia bacterium]|jgi:short-subunit dehydrogenase|nr:SDR family NAD(P)-dependent oxidoreductase [Thermoanaerobaculia bacterium]